MKNKLFWAVMFYAALFVTWVVALFILFGYAPSREHEEQIAKIKDMDFAAIQQFQNDFNAADLAHFTTLRYEIERVEGFETFILQEKNVRPFNSFYLKWTCGLQRLEAFEIVEPTGLFSKKKNVVYFACNFANFTSFGFLMDVLNQESAKMMKKGKPARKTVILDKNYAVDIHYDGERLRFWVSER